MAQALTKILSKAEFDKLAKALASKRGQYERCIVVCGGTGCVASGCKEVAKALTEQIEEQGAGNKVELRITGCHGLCEYGPLALVYPEKVLYQRVKPENAADIVAYALDKRGVIEELISTDSVSGEKIASEEDVPFYKNQMRLVFGNNELIDPMSIEDYISIGGYSAFCKALFDMTGEQVINEVKESGLRGRGGGGFLTGRKWESAAKAKSKKGQRYVICNADEGDPGAYMDRSLMEGNPHSVVEGMMIGARAIDSCEGYVYIRTEYPLAIERLKFAIEQCHQSGLLGKNILGSGFDFDIKIAQGSGAFVCGESSALIASIEGKAGEPRAKHIHMAESGLWEKPTVLNNVETWANIPIIINKGAEWFGSIGTEKSKGTKIFSLVGNVRNSGLVEVPMGITLGEIVNDIGGGVPEGRTFKAVQTGGPSGGCIPAEMMDLAVDFDSLTEVGSMMGSGGMIVMDDKTCMVDVARYFTEFLVGESCGKCTSCREGLRQMYAVLERICAGKGREDDLELLEDLCDCIGEASLCGLGTSAPNPVRSTLKYFKNEYLAHIRDGKCPAGVCTELLTFSIDAEKCIGCGACRKACPVEAISGGRKEVHVIDQSKCVKCGGCVEACKFGAVNV